MYRIIARPYVQRPEASLDEQQRCAVKRGAETTQLQIKLQTLGGGLGLGEEHYELASLLVADTDRRDQLQRRSDALELLYTQRCCDDALTSSDKCTTPIETAEPGRSLNKRRIAALVQLLAVPGLRHCQGAARMFAPIQSSHSMMDRRPAVHSLKPSYKYRTPALQRLGSADTRSPVVCFWSRAVLR